LCAIYYDELVVEAEKLTETDKLTLAELGSRQCATLIWPLKRMSFVKYAIRFAYWATFGACKRLHIVAARHIFYF